MYNGNIDSRDYPHFSVFTRYIMIPEEKKAGYITLKEAGERFGYSQDYLGQLIRKGKLEGKLVYSHVAWVTTPEAVERYLVQNKKKKQHTEEGKIPESLNEDITEPYDVGGDQYIASDLQQDTPVTSSNTTRVLFISYRILLLVIAVLGIFIFYLLTTAFGSELRSKTSAASTSVVFSVFQNYE